MDVKSEKNNGLLAGVSLPPSSRASRVSLAPETPFSFPFKRLPRRLSLKLPLLPAQSNWICGLQTEAACVLILRSAGGPRPSFEKTYGGFP